MKDDSNINVGRSQGERRLPIYFVIDASGDMSGAPIEAVRRRLEQFEIGVQGDVYALETVYIGIITFGGGGATFITKGLIPFDQFAPPQIDVSGQTPFGQALCLLNDSLDKDVRRHVRGGPKGDWKPLVFIVLGSEPTDDWKEAREKIRQRDSAKVCKVITVGCGPYVDYEKLKEIAIGETLSIDNDDASFHKFIAWPDTVTCLSDNNVILLSTEPDFINFGCLKPGLSAKKILVIQGGPAEVKANNEQIRIVPSQINEEITEIEIIVQGGEEGDLIWDSIQIDGINGKLEVPIMGYWEKSLSQSVVKTAIEPESYIEKTPERDSSKETLGQQAGNRLFEYPTNTNTPVTHQQEKRTFKASVCPICKRNLHYDSKTKSWINCEKCKSNVAVSLATLVTEEGTKGIQDLKKTTKDFWDVITGKKPW